jgi:hypothetical protein
MSLSFYYGKIGRKKGSEKSDILKKHFILEKVELG